MKRREPVRPEAGPPRPARAEPREIVELKRIKLDQPELGDAADLHIALVEIRKRVQARLPVAWLQFDPAWRKAELEAGRPLLRFHEIPIDWTEVRLMVRQTGEILHRFDALDPADYRAIDQMLREGGVLEPVVARWYQETAASRAVPRQTEPSDPPVHTPAVSMAALDQVLSLAMRPFLARVGEVIAQEVEWPEWRQSYCPVCGGDPEFAVVVESGQRRLICGRCTTQWSFGHWTCPYCLNDEQSRVTSFASRDGRYRLYACEVCRRYLKAYDARGAARPVLLEVDLVATLPLDAAAIQKGYKS